MRICDVKISEIFGECGYVEGVTEFYADGSSVEGVSTSCIKLEELNLNIYDGYVESFIEGTNELNVDFTFWAFQDSQTEEFLYAEQGSSLVVCISNYTRRKIDEIYELECNLVME